ncbi:ABC transporter ATP-binding protein [Dolosicoccus paucivorans]|uniref:ABC transporter ATP-binding protein n=1 Tax=Dolosicoccus paucivorans TaxID=84521 RepID=A0A2N6SL42_9LACT|nr:ABC transporter ATP-binding protein [Dolosicoccus paucivorans]PMB83756.1 ABC transporter ATP-binding protein [Dolosicoccus paucivorans]PMC57808.1 ABC transporter ATP-binding protein [Dolosicoccus paucivorans]
MIEINDLQIKYGDFVAMDDVNLTIQKGEFFTLLGPSGCGKTTTLRAIGGFLTPSRGNIVIDGKDVTHIPVEKRGLGMVFQSYALFPTMTVYDNIAYGLRVEKQSQESIDQRVRELAQLVELNETQLKRNVSELSGGQQQRVAIARALAKNPDIVLFDEPLSNLDAKLRRQLRTELKRIQKETGMTAIYVTHDQEEALELSDHIAVFNNGFIEQVGTPQEIYDRSATEFVCNFIGDANRLGPELMEYISQVHPEIAFDPQNKHYLREEKIRFTTDDSSKLIPLEAQVVETNFYGVYTSYTVKVFDTLLQTINKRDGFEPIQTEGKVKIYINPEDILTYGVDGHA